MRHGFSGGACVRTPFSFLLQATKPHRVDEAMVHLQQVVQLRPDFSDGFLVSEPSSFHPLHV